MSDEFIIEEEESSGRSRSFITALGILLAVLFAGIACLIIAVVRNGADNSNGNGELAEVEIAMTATTMFIETANAEIATANQMVTQTLEARATNDALPTETPVPTETLVPPTATATDTPAPTDTTVVSDDGDGDDEGDGTGDGDGTGGGDDGDGDTVGGDADPTATVSVLSTPIAGDGGAATATPIVGGSTGGNDGGSGELPQTGVSPWGAIVAGLALVLVLVGARRLRSA